MSNTKKISFKNFDWINITNPDDNAIDQLREKFHFHPLNLSECLSPAQRSKVDTYMTYAFIVMLFPTYIKKTREIKSGELDFFIGKKFIITINRGNFPSFTEFFKMFEFNDNLRKKYTDGSPERLLYEILNKQFYYCYPMIDHLIIDCDNIEKAIFNQKERQMVSEILVIRRNITDFRKIMQVHKNVLKKLIVHLKENPSYAMRITDDYYESLVDYTKEIWDTLDNLKERIEALQATNESQISFQLSDVMRHLTIISVITFPLTLIASIFGMNAYASMPIINRPFGFWLIISFMFFVGMVMIYWFKKNKWF